MKHEGVWRKPDEQTEDYPGLIVHDGRVSGSITFGKSRLPLWAVIGDLCANGWESVEHNYEPSAYGWDEWHQFAQFLSDLLQARGEVGRLLCVLADAERRERDREEERLEGVDHDGIIDQSPWKDEDPDADPPVIHGADPWWAVPEERNRVREALHRCLDALSEESVGGWRSAMREVTGG